MADTHDPEETGPVRPTSGNRWEPDPATPTPDAAPAAEAAPAAAAPAADAAATPKPTWRERVRVVRVPAGKRGMVGAAAGTLLIGGLGGFGVGYAAGDSGGDGYELTGVNGGVPGGDSGRGPGGDADGDFDGDGFGHHDHGGPGFGRDGDGPPSGVPGQDQSENLGPIEGELPDSDSSV